jgi:hypothetical protein
MPDRAFAQVDFGDTVVVIGGVERTPHFFVLDLPHGDAGCIRACPSAAAPHNMALKPK